jgi:peptidoglycan/xylan/chitin deacetylase (PgdA/CDA1 family)
MKRKKIINFTLYSVAALFLAYHLMPVFSAGANLAPKEVTRAELAASAQCSANTEITVPTFGHPLRDPIITDLTARRSLVTQQANMTTLYDQSKVSQVQDWESSRYGTNDGVATLQSSSTPQQAIFRVDMNNLKDGDAKWLSPRFSVRAGEYVTVSFRYRANQEFKPTAIFIDNDGDTQYIPQTVRSASEGWSNEKITFVVPANTQGLRFAANLEDNGWLETTDYQVSVQPLPQLQRGVATFTFDDGWKSIHDQGLPLFERYGVKTTQYVVADYEGNDAYMDQKMIQDFRDAGHDIGSHSYSHADLTTLSTDKLSIEVAGSAYLLNKSYDGVNNFAAPFGRYNDAVTNTIAQCYQSHRTTDAGYNAAGYDRYKIKVQNVEVDTTPEQIKAWADFAQQNKLWLILVYHQVETGGEYSVDTTVLESQIKAVKETGIHTATFEQALLETYPQGR